MNTTTAERDRVTDPRYALGFSGELLADGVFRMIVAAVFEQTGQPHLVMPKTRQALTWCLYQESRSEWLERLECGAQSLNSVRRSDHDKGEF